ncbi:MAG: hypothetical protein J1E81_03175 [Eubacterium sp.]|nr:hypothetical protein [Eubacterium sp.]
MKQKIFLSVLLIIVMTISIFSLSSCSNSTDYIIGKIDVKILNVCNATEDDFKRYNNAFAAQNVEFIIDNYRLLKVTYELSNNNDFPINITGTQSISNDDIYLPSDSVDFEPTYPISANSSVEVDIYIYVNNDLDNENEILNKLNDLNIVFSAFKVD